jgi:hypothetical protein
MGRDDEWIRGDEWMSGGAVHHAGYGEATAVPGTGVPGAAWTTVWGHETDEDDEADEDDWPDEDSLDDDWPDDGSPDDEWLDDGWLDGQPFGAPGGPSGPRLGPGSGHRRGWGHGGFPGFPTWMAVAVIVAAGIAGVAVGFLLTRGTPAASGALPSASAPPSVQTSAPPSTGSGAGPQARPGLPGNASGNGDGQLRMLLTGRVLAVSGTSVTIGGVGPSVAAAVTSTTKLTGHVHDLSGIKVGDGVSAQITGTPSHLVITTLQDPAQ